MIGSLSLALIAAIVAIAMLLRRQVDVDEGRRTTELSAAPANAMDASVGDTHERPDPDQLDTASEYAYARCMVPQREDTSLTGASNHYENDYTPMDDNSHEYVDMQGKNNDYLSSEEVRNAGSDQQGTVHDYLELI